MQAVATRITDGLDAITIRVRDLDKSCSFYTQVFGLRPTPDPLIPAGAVVLQGPLPASAARGIRLVADQTDLPAARIRLDLFCAEDLLDVYMVARLLGAATDHFGRERDALTARIFDPDGNTIELTCPATEDGQPATRIPGRFVQERAEHDRPGSWITCAASRLPRPRTVDRLRPPGYAARTRRWSRASDSRAAAGRRLCPRHGDAGGPRH